MNIAYGPSAAEKLSNGVGKGENVLVSCRNPASAMRAMFKIVIILKPGNGLLVSGLNSANYIVFNDSAVLKKGRGFIHCAYSFSIQLPGLHPKLSR
jgi:hypothetical protein